jgi:hypothetical protein
MSAGSPSAVASEVEATRERPVADAEEQGIEQRDPERPQPELDDPEAPARGDELAERD